MAIPTLTRSCMLSPMPSSAPSPSETSAPGSQTQTRAGKALTAPNSSAKSWMTRLNGWQLGNLDSTVITEKPKLAPYKLQIRQSIADIFNCPVEKISLKAKTNERQDAIGQGLALAAHAIVLMQRER